MSEWIPVTERLPNDVLDLKDNKQIKVLVYTSSGLIKSCLFGWEKDCNGNFVGWKFTRCDVTHWMPLPEPPKKEESENG